MSLVKMLFVSALVYAFLPALYGKLLDFSFVKDVGDQGGPDKAAKGGLQGFGGVFNKPQMGKGKKNMGSKSMDTDQDGDDFQKAAMLAMGMSSCASDDECMQGVHFCCGDSTGKCIQGKTPMFKGRGYKFSDECPAQTTSVVVSVSRRSRKLMSLRGWK